MNSDDSPLFCLNWGKQGIFSHIKIIIKTRKTEKIRIIVLFYLTRTQKKPKDLRRKCFASQLKVVS